MVMLRTAVIPYLHGDYHDLQGNQEKIADRPSTVFLSGLNTQKEIPT